MTNEQIQAIQNQAIQNQQVQTDKRAALKDLEQRTMQAALTNAQSKEQTDPKTWGDNLNDILSASAAGLTDMYRGYIDAQIAAANIANSASAQAQRNQFEYNNAMMEMQNAKQDQYLKNSQEFNTLSALKANEFSERMWEKTAAYNKEMYENSKAFNQSEAEKQRKWAEEMSSTAYQRAVKDMKAAGINPILAAMNGGASIGSGTTASIGSSNMGSSSGQMATSSTPGAASGSVGNYAGQGYHISDSMAIMGSVIGMFGEAMSALSANKESLPVVGEIIKGTEDVLNEMQILSKTNERRLKQDVKEHGSNFWDWITFRTKEYYGIK